jgi:hypothetical protein
MPRRAQNERVPIWKQFKLEFVEENKISDFCVVRCGNNFVIKSPMDWWPHAKGKREIAVAKVGSSLRRKDRATLHSQEQLGPRDAKTQP